MRPNNTIYKVLFFVSVLSTVFSCKPRFEENSTNIHKPNILFILVDNLDYNTIGNSSATTNINHIINTGALFTQGYCTSVLAPMSEESILTGKFPARSNTENLTFGENNIITHYSLTANDITLPETLKEIGYTTYMAGHWNFDSKTSLPQAHGFDIHITPDNNQDLEKSFQKLSDSTIRFIESHKDSTFMAFLSLSTTTNKTLSIQSTDQYIGQILKTLDSSKLRDNTLIILTSSNPKADKLASLHRVPYIINMPWLKSKGKVIDTPVIGTDFYPTILALTGANLITERKNDGFDLLPLLNGETIKDRALIWYYPYSLSKKSMPYCIIQKGKWQLVHYFGYEKDKLFNIEEGLQEQNNVIGKYAVIAEELSELLFIYLYKVGASYPTQVSSNLST